MARPKVNVIIPCYNNEATIGETLKSVQNQTLNDWVAIVVNDGSTDGSAEIIRKYCNCDSRIQYVDQQNQGLASARNAGIAVADGEFINFLDADDLFLQDMLKRMVEKLEKDPGLGAVYCGSILSGPELDDLRWSVCANYEGQLFKKLAHQNLFPCHSVLLRRQILEDTGMFDSTLRHSHDWDLWLRVARTGVAFGCISDPLVIYRMTPVSLSRSPLTFFEAGKEVLRRGHGPDVRVKNSEPEFIQGCRCPMKQPVLKRLLFCVGLAIAQGDTDQAYELFEKNLTSEGLNVTPNDMIFMVNGLWFGAAIPKGNWEILSERIGVPLFQFLLKGEKDLEIPGFAMQCIFKITGSNNYKPRLTHEAMNGRQLFSALQKKVANRVLSLIKPRCGN